MVLSTFSRTVKIVLSTFSGTVNMVLITFSGTIKMVFSTFSGTDHMILCSIHVYKCMQILLKTINTLQTCSSTLMK